MAQLVQSFVGDTALRLQDEEFVRQLEFGTNWTHVRIGVWVSIPAGNATLGTPSPTLFMGLCQGTTNTYKSTTTTEWVGLRWGQGGTNWNYNAGPPAYFSTGNARSRIYRIGNTTTSGGIMSLTEYMPISVRALILTDILKTATGYSIGSFSQQSIPTGPGSWSTEMDFLFGAHGETGIVDYAALTFSSGYLLDTLSIYWNLATLGVEISSIVVVRVV